MKSSLTKKPGFKQTKIGLIPEDWDIKQLIDMSTDIVDCPHWTPVWTSSGYIVLRNQNIKNGKLDISNPSYTNEIDFNKRNIRLKLIAGDIVLTREAPMGEVCIVPPNVDCCLGQRMVQIRLDKKRYHNIFVLYSMQGKVVQNQIDLNRGAGSTVSNIRIPVIKGLTIPIPPLPEQKAIADLLSTWDEAIEKTERLIILKHKFYVSQLSKRLSLDVPKRIKLKKFIKEVSKRNRNLSISQVLSVTNSNGFVLPEEQFGRRIASVYWPRFQPSIFLA